MAKKLKKIIKFLVTGLYCTCFHPAAFEFFNAVNFLAAAFVDAGHVISLPLTFAPTFIVE